MSKGFEGSTFSFSFLGSLDDPDPFLQPAPLKLCHQLIEDIKWFKVTLISSETEPAVCKNVSLPCSFTVSTQQYIPLLAVFRNLAMRQIHWDEMSAIAGFDLTPDAGTTFRKIIDMHLMEDLEK